MSRETDKLAIATADAVIATDGRLDKTREALRAERQRLDRLTDAPGERIRQATLALQLTDWAAARLSPRRRRSDKIAAFDERVGELEARMGALSRESAELYEKIPAAEAEHSAAVAAWHADGGKGSRPLSRVPELEARLRETQEDHTALGALVGEVLAEKTAYVESHRKSLEKDARAAVEEASAGYREAAEHLVQARAELEDARRDELYFKLYPHEATGSGQTQVPLLGGAVARMREAVPGWQVTLGVPELRRLLDADAQFLATMVTPQQAEVIRASDPEAVRLDREAFWQQTEAGQEALRRERQEVRDAYRREWGTNPGW
jgi:hypothetical protein